MTSIVKTTSKGQITLPAKWRKNFDTDTFVLEDKGNCLEIMPLDMKKFSSAKQYIIFDAARDNKGKGIKAKELIKILKKIEK